MADDRDWSWVGVPAAPPPIYPEAVVWRVVKDSRWAEARIRQVPHGQELRFIVGGAGRDDVLMQSTVYNTGEIPEMGTMSTGTLQNFVGHGWQVEADTIRESS